MSVTTAKQYVDTEYSKLIQQKDEEIKFLRDQIKNIESDYENELINIKAELNRAEIKILKLEYNIK